MNSLRESVTAFLENESKKDKKAVPVIVLSKENTYLEPLNDYVYKKDMGLVTLDASTIQDYFALDGNGNLLTDKFADKIRESKVVPFVLAIQHIHRVNWLGVHIMREIAYAATDEKEVSWLFPGSSIVFVDYEEDKPRPFFLSECNLAVLSV